MTITRFIDLGKQVHSTNSSNNNARIHASNISTSTSRGIANQDHIKHPYFLRGTSNRFSSHHGEESPTENKLLTVNPFVHPKRQKISEYSDRKSCESSNEQEEDLANCLVMLSSGSTFSINTSSNVCIDKDAELITALFQCKGCKKNFNSHQALGGHRASHKKVKGCFASSFDTNTEDSDTSNAHINPVSDPEETYDFLSSPFSDSLDLPSPTKSKVHECSICRRIFSSGQALGGHKRCHWLHSSYGSPSNSQDSTVCQSIPNLIYHTDHMATLKIIPSIFDYNSCNYNELTSKFNNTEVITGVLSEKKQNEGGKDNDDEKRENKNVSVDNSPSCVDGNYYGMNDMKMKGVCSSWLQIGMSSDANNNGNGPIG